MMAMLTAGDNTHARRECIVGLVCCAATCILHHGPHHLHPPSRLPTFASTITAPTTLPPPSRPPTASSITAPTICIHHHGPRHLHRMQLHDGIACILLSCTMPPHYFCSSHPCVHFPPSHPLLLHIPCLACCPQHLAMGPRLGLPHRGPLKEKWRLAAPLKCSLCASQGGNSQGSTELALPVQQWSP